MNHVYCFSSMDHSGTNIKYISEIASTVRRRRRRLFNYNFFSNQNRSGY